MIRVVFLISFIVFSYINAENNISYAKQKLEIQELKKELNNFYNRKEKEYKERKKELDTILKQVQKEKEEIKSLHDNNLSLLQDIKQTVESKTSKIYNKMKPKIAAKIFDEMMNEGKIDDVFDIILRIKEKNITAVMRYLSIPNAAMLTQMLKDYNSKDRIKEK